MGIQGPKRIGFDATGGNPVKGQISTEIDREMAIKIGIARDKNPIEAKELERQYYKELNGRLPTELELAWFRSDLMRVHRDAYSPTLD